MKKRNRHQNERGGGMRRVVVLVAIAALGIAVFHALAEDRSCLWKFDRLGS